MMSGGWNLLARLLHHALFLLSVGGFIIHVYMSTVMLPGTMPGMTGGKVTRAWAAWHHPRWFRKQEAGRN
jgi:cytochrome b subunit of formate dehydrogenase